VVHAGLFPPLEAWSLTGRSIRTLLLLLNYQNSNLLIAHGVQATLDAMEACLITLSSTSDMLQVSKAKMLILIKEKMDFALLILQVPSLLIIMELSIFLLEMKLVCRIIYMTKALSVFALRSSLTFSCIAQESIQAKFAVQMENILIIAY